MPDVEAHITGTVWKIECEVGSKVEEGDTVVEDAGARVFVDAVSTVQLDDRVLDAQIDENGGVGFALAQRR